MSTSTRRDTVDLPEGLGHGELLTLYERMKLIRHFELAAQEVYRKGEMPGFIHLYVGEEAVAAGVCAHLRPDDWITSTHRGHGHALAKGVSPKRVMAELYGRATGCCGGRGGSMHLYSAVDGLFGTNGLVGAGIPPAVGVGLSAKARGTDQVAVAFFGDGAVNHGAFHESINFAGAQDAPVLFVCENNLYATATPLSVATKNTDIASRAAAYGIPGIAVDGNDVIDVWRATKEAVDRARSGKGPTLLEARTYRTVGHHEGDPLVGTYRTQAELDQWKERCPIAALERRLLDADLATPAALAEIDERVRAKIAEALEFSRQSAQPDPEKATEHVWAEPLHAPIPDHPAAGATQVQGWLDAVRDGIAEEMRLDPAILYLGEGTGERGGSFAHTKGLWAEFGGGRLIDTPISELGFTGAAIGASATGCRTVADLMFVDFLFDAASQIVHQAAKLRYMSNGQIGVPMVIRASWGTVKNTGPHHSGSYHPIWAHCPGLIVVVPSTPADAKGLIKTALRARDPVLFLEPKALFSTKGPVPTGEHLVPFGVARILRSGTQLSLVSCGTPVHRCLEAAEVLARAGIECEVIDLRSIVPLDVATIVASVAKTGRLLIVDEGHAMCGIGAEVAAAVMEEAFDELDAPIGRLHPEAVPQPFSPAHENAIIVTTDRIIAAAKGVIAGTPPVPRRLQGQGGGGRSGGSGGGSGEERRLEGAGSTASVSAMASPPLNPPPAQVKPSATECGTRVPIILPNQDLTITEATVVGWKKKVGEYVKANEEVVEVETDKAIFGVEAPVSGRLVEIVAPEGSIVPLGETLGMIEPGAGDA